MKKRVTVLIFALAALLAGTALWPYAPRLETLTVESATVRVKHPGPVVREAVFRTASGAEVACARGKSGGCPIEHLVQMEASQAQLTVWHDGARVFQIADKERIFYPYADIYSGRAIGLVMAALVALFGLVRLAFDTGLINQYDDQGKSL